MPPDNILTLLRNSTMPIHRKLDNAGLGAKIKSKTFDNQDYKSWLKFTLLTQQFLFNTKERFIGSPFSKFVPDDLGISLLKKDLELLSDSFGSSFKNDQNLLIKGDYDHDDYLIAAAYTYIGSSLGSNLICSYVQEHIPDAPINFLTFMSSQIKHWAKFKEVISHFELTIEKGKLEEFSRLIFEKIYEIQQIEGLKES